MNSSGFINVIGLAVAPLQISQKVSAYSLCTLQDHIP